MGGLPRLPQRLLLLQLRRQAQVASLRSGSRLLRLSCERRKASRVLLCAQSHCLVFMLRKRLDGGCPSGLHR
jgi:hypothetical protein